MTPARVITPPKAGAARPAAAPLEVAAATAEEAPDPTRDETLATPDETAAAATLDAEERVDAAFIVAPAAEAEATVVVAAPEAAGAF